MVNDSRLRNYSLTQKYQISWQMFKAYYNSEDVNMEAKAKWQCPKCGVGLPPTYKIEGLCSMCRVYEDSDRLLKGYRLNKRTITNNKIT